MKTLVAFVLDESGSMFDTASDTCGAVNQYFETLAKETPEASVSLMKFSERFEGRQASAFRVIAAAVSPSAVPKLDVSNYRPSGNTPLYDAIGKAITETAAVPADRYFLIVLSDGLENASNEWTQQTLRSLVEAKQSDGNWTIIYLGANQDAILTSSRIGVYSGNTIAYAQTSGGISATADSLAQATTSGLRSAGLTTNSFFSDAGQTEADYSDPKTNLWTPKKEESE